MIEEHYLKVMDIILSRLKDLTHPWAVTGSLGLLIQGIEVDVNDIDLQSTKEGVYAIERVLEEYVIHKVEYLESMKIQSYLGELKIEGIKVEIMGDVQKELPGGGWEPPNDLSKSIHWVKVDGWSIPVLDLVAEYRAYRLLGRDEKAEKIHAALIDREDADWKEN
jgi:hypothetical protein